MESLGYFFSVPLDPFDMEFPEDAESGVRLCHDSDYPTSCDGLCGAFKDADETSAVIQYPSWHVRADLWIGHTVGGEPLQQW